MKQKDLTKGGFYHYDAGVSRKKGVVQYLRPSSEAGKVVVNWWEVVGVDPQNTDPLYPSVSVSTRFITGRVLSGEGLTKAKDMPHETQSEWEKMTYEEKVQYATGQLIIAIGEGKFRERASILFNAFTTDGFERGKKVSDAP